MYLLDIDDKALGKDESNFKIDRISPSMMMTYTNCPLDFYYSYIAKIRIEGENLHLLFGSAVHGAIEAMYEGHLNPVDKFDEIFVKEELDAESKKSFGEYYLLGHEMVKNYLEFHPILDTRFALKAGISEHRVRAPIQNPITKEYLRVPLSGILDRLTDGHRIIEYKTAKKKWDTSEERFKVQTLLYNLWYLTEYGKIADETVYLILLKKYRKTVRDETTQIIAFKPTIEDLAEMWEKVDTTLDMIEAGQFERPGGRHPPYCNCYKYERMLNITNHYN